MLDYNEALNIIKSSDKNEFSIILDAANTLIKTITNDPKSYKIIIDSLDEIFINQEELIKIRIVEVALKLLDYSFYANNIELADKIFDFLRKHILKETENVQTAVIIHYSWAHRKYPQAKNIVNKYRQLIHLFNQDNKFLVLFNEINNMEGIDPVNIKS